MLYTATMFSGNIGGKDFDGFNIPYPCFPLTCLGQRVIDHRKLFFKSFERQPGIILKVHSSPAILVERTLHIYGEDTERIILAKVELEVAPDTNLLQPMLHQDQFLARFKSFGICKQVRTEILRGNTLALHTGLNLTIGHQAEIHIQLRGKVNLSKDFATLRIVRQLTETLRQPTLLVQTAV
jgi:hypothetical protein